MTMSPFWWGLWGTFIFVLVAVIPIIMMVRPQRRVEVTASTTQASDSAIRRVYRNKNVWYGVVAVIALLLLWGMWDTIPQPAVQLTAAIVVGLVGIILFMKGGRFKWFGMAMLIIALIFGPHLIKAFDVGFGTLHSWSGGLLEDRPVQVSTRTVPQQQVVVAPVTFLNVRWAGVSEGELLPVGVWSQGIKVPLVNKRLYYPSGEGSHFKVQTCVGGNCKERTLGTHDYADEIRIMILEAGRGTTKFVLEHK